MGADSPPPGSETHRPNYGYDPLPRVTTVTYDSESPPPGSVEGRGGEAAKPPPPPFRWEHLPDKGLYALTLEKTGNTEFWRDRPTRYLVVQPDEETAGFEPVLKYGRPVYLWLCREEREGPARSERG